MYSESSFVDWCIRACTRVERWGKQSILRGHPAGNPHAFVRGSLRERGKKEKDLAPRETVRSLVFERRERRFFARRFGLLPYLLSVLLFVEFSNSRNAIA